MLINTTVTTWPPREQPPKSGLHNERTPYAWDQRWDFTVLRKTFRKRLRPKNQCRVVFRVIYELLPGVCELEKSQSGDGFLFFMTLESIENRRVPLETVRDS